MKDTDIGRMRKNDEICADLQIPPNVLKRKYLLEGAFPKTHKSASSNSGGVGRAGRRIKRVARK